MNYQKGNHKKQTFELNDKVIVMKDNTYYLGFYKSQSLVKDKYLFEVNIIIKDEDMEYNIQNYVTDRNNVCRYSPSVVRNLAKKLGQEVKKFKK